jgi:hypothetical protein
MYAALLALKLRGDQEAFFLNSCNIDGAETGAGADLRLYDPNTLVVMVPLRETAKNPAFYNFYNFIAAALDAFGGGTEIVYGILESNGVPMDIVAGIQLNNTDIIMSLYETPSVPTTSRSPVATPHPRKTSDMTPYPTSTRDATSTARQTPSPIPTASMFPSWSRQPIPDGRTTSSAEMFWKCFAIGSIAGGVIFCIAVVCVPRCVTCYEKMKLRELAKLTDSKSGALFTDEGEFGLQSIDGASPPT